MNYLFFLIFFIACSQVKTKNDRYRKKKIIVSQDFFYSIKKEMNLYYGPNFSGFTAIAYPLKEIELHIDIKNAPVGTVCKLGRFGKITNLKSFILQPQKLGNDGSLYCKYDNHVDFGSRSISVEYSILKPEVKVVDESFDFEKLKSSHRSKIPNFKLFNYIRKSTPNNEVLILKKSNSFVSKLKLKNTSFMIDSISKTGRGVTCKIGNTPINSLGKRAVFFYNYSGQLICSSDHEKALITFKIARDRSIKRQLFEEKKIITLDDEVKIELNEMYFNIDYLSKKFSKHYKMTKTSYYTKERIKNLFPQYILANVEYEEVYFKLQPQIFSIIYNKNIQLDYTMFNLSFFNIINLKLNGETIREKYNPLSFFQIDPVISSIKWSSSFKSELKKSTFCSKNTVKVLSEIKALRSDITNLDSIDSILYRNRNTSCQKRSIKKFKIPRTNKVYYVGQNTPGSDFNIEQVSVEYSNLIDGHMIYKSMIKEAPPKYLGKKTKKSADYLIINEKIHSLKE